MSEKFWTFLEKPLTQTGVALVLAIVGTIVPSKLALALAGGVFLLAVYREGWLKHGRWYIRGLRFFAASTVIACILGAAWVAAWRFRERPSPAMTETAQKSNTLELAPQSPSQPQPATQSEQPLKEEKKSQPSKRETPKNKSNGDASGKPPKGEPDPDTTTETYSTKDSLHTNAHHVGTKDEAKAVVNRGGLTQGPVAIAPNGIANAAPNYGNQTVVNPTPPLPHVTWTQEQLRPGVGLDASGMFSVTPEYLRKQQLRKDNPGVMVRLSTDASFSNAAFAAECDKPCEGVEAAVANGISSVGQGNASDRIVLIGVAMPGTVNAGQTVTWEVRSETTEPITIKQVQSVKPK